MQQNPSMLPLPAAIQPVRKADFGTQGEYYTVTGRR